MGFLQDFQASTGSLPTILQRHYATLRDLDKSLQGVQQQNEQRCEQEIEELRRGIESGSIAPGSSRIRFSDEALDEQKHCTRIADEKVALATLAYDLVDEQIRQLDQYMRKLEALRQEKELAVAAGASSSNNEATTRSGRSSESGRGGRKKSKLTATTEAPPSMDMELPVDPNEPTYCVCNQVSWGEMVACDNPGCKIEWFHFQCVGLKEQPKGKWYCPSCIGLPKRRKGK